MNAKTQPVLIDQALEFLSDTGPEYKSGLSNHGPMLADALISLKRSSRVMPWLVQYKTHLNPAPKSKGNLINEHDYHTAFSDIDRFPDWQIFFRSQLKQNDWKQVVNTWVDALSPGYIAAAMHGVIRTGHAVRSLSRHKSAHTLNELADGLAYWAARYQSLPENAPGSSDASYSIYDALQMITLLPESQRIELPLISEEVEAVKKMATFSQIINSMKQDEQPDKVLSDLTEGFASMFVCNAEASKNVIAVVHSLTGPYALRHMLPYLEESVARKALRYAWQASAALYVRYGISFSVVQTLDASIDSQTMLVENAIATGDEHAVKFVEACLTEHGLNANPVYLSAAAICCNLLQ